MLDCSCPCWCLLMLCAWWCLLLLSRHYMPQHVDVAASRVRGARTRLHGAPTKPEGETSAERARERARERERERRGGGRRGGRRGGPERRAQGQMRVSTSRSRVGAPSATVSVCLPPAPSNFFSPTPAPPRAPAKSHTVGDAQTAP